MQEVVKLSEIIVKSNVRTIEKAETDKTLQANIESYGLLNPLTVSAVEGTDEYQLIAGHRRLKAVKALKWDEVLVNIIEAPNGNLEMIQMSENLHRREMRLGEYVTVLKKYIEAGKSIKDVALLLGKDVKWTKSIARLTNLIAPAIKALDYDNVEDAAKIASFSKKLQNKCHKSLAERDYSFGQGNMWWTLARELRSEDNSVPMERMPWDMEAKDFGSACHGCMHRSEKQLKMFAETSDDQTARCFKASCFHNKMDAFQEHYGEYFSHLKLTDYVSYTDERKTIQFSEFGDLDTSRKLKNMLKKATKWEGFGGDQVVLFVPRAKKTLVKGEDGTTENVEVDELYSKRFIKAFARFLYPNLVNLTWNTLIRKEADLNGEVSMLVLKDQIKSGLNEINNTFGWEDENAMPDAEAHHQFFRPEWVSDTVSATMMNMRLALLKHRVATAGSVEKLVHYLAHLDVNPYKWLLQVLEDQSTREEVYAMFTMTELKSIAKELEIEVTGTKKAVVAALAMDIRIPSVFVTIMTMANEWMGMHDSMTKEDAILFYPNTKFTKPAVVEPKLLIDMLSDEGDLVMPPEPEPAPETMILHFTECEHDGDMEVYMTDITHSGGSIIRTELNDEAETCEINFSVGNKAQFLVDFATTQSHGFSQLD